MKYHEYYMMPYMIILSLVAGFGMYKLTQNSLKWAKYLAYSCFYLVPVIAVIRIYPARWLTDTHLLPDELYYSDTRESLIRAVPNNSLCIVGPDPSGAIFFYMLHKKGFGVLNCADMIQDFEKYNKYATHLYWYEKECAIHSEILTHLEIIREVGNFKVYRIKKNKSTN
ncbi:MAG: hypothetical protein NZ455_14780 [Bacteroidia bacterium]|nr:hypothetical protein [Bacteroidia bacterium]MDW8347960.1 hypothetical protein [Bacteroidia bacterium]